MITIDGSQGEGGGQILRTSLALSIVTGQPLRMINIRSGRKRPGLMRQHLTAVRAAVEICNGEVEGAAIGSRELTFRPGSVRAGDYTFSIGTAGSTSLVFQTILPALLIAPESSRLTLEGGTHNPLAPPFDFIAEAFLPLLNRMGPRVTVKLDRYGFYPAGGGRWTVAIEPVSQLQALRLSARGDILQRKAVALCAGLPGHIAERELSAVSKLLNWSEDRLQQRSAPREQGPGNFLKICLQSEHVTEVFSGFGQVGVSAERVAKHCAQEVRRYLAAEVAVGEHLADQLLLPLALAGSGEFVTLKPSRHTRTNIAVIERFLPLRFVLEERGRDVWFVGLVGQE